MADPNEIFGLVEVAALRIDQGLPVTPEQADALLSYCAGLETVVNHLREQNAALRERAMRLELCITAPYTRPKNLQ